MLYTLNGELFLSSVLVRSLINHEGIELVIKIRSKGIYLNLIEIEEQAAWSTNYKN